MRKAQKGVRILKLFYFFLEEEVLINTGCFVNNFILHFYFLWGKKKYIKCIQKQLGKSLQNSYLQAWYFLCSLLLAITEVPSYDCLVSYDKYAWLFLLLL